jgi:putative ABC transport system permease protein
MRPIRAFLLRLGGLFHKERRDRELAEEIESNLQLHIEDNLRAGMSPEDARREALLKFGGVESAKEAYRDRRSLPLLDHMMQDLRYGVRILLKSPSLTAITILILALGISSNTAIFSIINAVLLRPYPHLDIDRWAYLNEKPNVAGLNLVAVSVPTYRDWKAQSRSFTDMVLLYPYTVNLSSSGEAERVQIVYTSPEIFSALGSTPAAGRLVRHPDDGDRVAVISYSLWQRRFGGDPNLPGKKIDLNLVPFTVIGVAPPDLSFPPNIKVDVWSLYSEQNITSPTGHDGRNHSVVAKLRDGVDFKQAQAEMDVIAGNLASQYREMEGWGARVTPMRESLAGNLRKPLFVLSGALALVLLLACVNIANLQLVRLEARRKEIATRAALGAGRLRLARQILTEGLILGIVAGAIGISLVPTEIKLLLSFVPPQQLPWLAVKIDGRVLAVSAGITILVTITFSLLSMFRALPRNIVGALTSSRLEGGSVAINRRLRKIFLIAQVALSLVPLVGAALLIQSFIRLLNVEPGFNADHRLTLTFTAPRARYNEPGKLADLAERIQSEVGQIPGVKAAGLAQYLPFATTVGWGQAITRQDPHSIANPAALPHAHYNVISTGYVEALGLPIKAGRTFTKSDNKNSTPVVIINEALARRYFADEDPIGKQMWVGHAQALTERAPHTIIGVTGNALLTKLEEKPGPAAWVPVSQQPDNLDGWRTMYLVAHTSADPRDLIAAVRGRIGDVDADLALADIKTQETRVSESVWRQRLMVYVLTALGLAAVIIAVLGVYGIISYLVSRRTQEIGVRVALGATRSNIIRMVVSEGLWPVLAGIGLGIAGALALIRVLSSLLYGVDRMNPITIVISAVLLAGVALLACYIPARRAARIDPMAALRHD